MHLSSSLSLPLRHRLKLETGDTVRAAFDGMVRISKVGVGYGNYVLIRHNNGFRNSIWSSVKTIGGYGTESKSMKIQLGWEEYRS